MKLHYNVYFIHKTIQTLQMYMLALSDKIKVNITTKTLKNSGFLRVH